MATLDVTDAPDRLLSYQNILRSHCLMYVSRAIRNGATPLKWAGLDTAWNCWQYNAGDKHTGRNVPRGFPAFLGVKRGNADGDVIISLGGGKFAATDHPWGEVGICTLAEREIETGRKFVGWAGELFGYTLTTTATASLDVTPIKLPIGEQDMQYWKHDPSGIIVALDNARGEYRQLSAQEVNGLQNTVAAGLARIDTLSEPAWTQTFGPLRGVNANQSQPLAAAGGAVAQIDYAALAKAVNDDAAARLAQ